MAFLGRVARHRPSLLLNHAADAAPLGGIRSFATHSSRASPLLRASATDTSTGALLHHPPAGATPASLRRAHATVAGAAASPASLRRAHATVAAAAASPAPLRRSHATVAGAAASPAPLPRAHATVAGSAASPAPLRRAHATVAGAAASPAPLRRAYATVAGAAASPAPLRRAYDTLAGAAASPAPLRRAYDTLAGAAASPAPLRRAYNTLAGATPYSAPLRRVTVPGALLRHHAGPGALLRRAPSFSTKTVFITEEAASLIEKEMARMEAVDLQKIPPHILHLLCRIEASEVGRHRDLADTVTRLTLTVTEKHGEACLKRSDAVNHIASVSWRVSTGVLAVTVGAAMGLLQVVKPQWEVEFLESACQFVSVKLKGMEGELRDFLHNGILQKKAIANAYTFLEEERQKDLALGLEKRESEVMARRKDFIRRKGAVLAEWDINLTKRESQSP